MKCPHCSVAFNSAPKFVDLDKDILGNWIIERNTCPECKKAIFALRVTKHANSRQERMLVYPKGSIRPPAPQEVRDESPHVAEDYEEACLVLPDSSKASAALGRRCLQGLLVEKAGVNPKDTLSKQIQDVLDSKKLPGYLSEDLDSVRNIGNFAAHPMKSTSSGSVQNVEPEEAEWTLNILESLFDFYYVQPQVSKNKRAALDAKLAASGRQPMKQP